MATVSNTYFPAPSLRGNVIHIWETMRENAAKRAVYRQTVKELESLSNRDLADLGLSRSAIRGIALEAAYGN